MDKLLESLTQFGIGGCIAGVFAWFCWYLLARSSDKDKTLLDALSKKDDMSRLDMATVREDCAKLLAAQETAFLKALDALEEKRRIIVEDLRKESQLLLQAIRSLEKRLETSGRLK